MTAETPLNKALLEYKLAKEAVEKAQSRLGEATALLVYQLEANHIKSHSFGSLKATVVRSNSVSWDEKGLKKAIGARVFNKLTTAKLDTKKLEAAIRDEQVDQYVAFQYATVKESNPYIKLTESKQ